MRGAGGYRRDRHHRSAPRPTTLHPPLTTHPVTGAHKLARKPELASVPFAIFFPSPHHGLFRYSPHFLSSPSIFELSK
ncbi:hypothetical protein E2C01_036529 [Portunus trituberculatus]|uniref:Uncharacterized protein n=1 Tax=Portunus trituberculatus TaxID=210409 RepID=A0A5B7FCQ5_PORTR|nr:hypothetical protein [Portunus trituberculatus]